MRVLPLISLLTVFACQTLSASVVMTGTRVIYPASAKEKTVQLKNADNMPYIVQLQIEGVGDTSDDKNIPFVATPQIFRMEPGTGQSIRMIKTGGSNLPSDRESLFIFSFTQIPAIHKNDINKNKLILMITNRVKIFYRPDKLARYADTKEIGNALTLQRDGNTINVSNPGGYYVSIRSANLLAGNKTIALSQNAIIAPRSAITWRQPLPANALNGARLRLILINDFGVDVVIDRQL